MSSEGAERRAHLARAQQAAEEATHRYPGNEWGWLTLADVLLNSREGDAAAQAAIRALTVNPWLKKALLEGTFGRQALIESLLQIETFRRVWEALPVRVP